MRRRQTSLPRAWFILDAVAGADVRATLCRLPRGTGLLILSESAEVRRLARIRGLPIISEADESAVRVHDARELRRAMLRRTPWILLSPIHTTDSHPDWAPLPRMRAAALARLAGRRLVALGGMDARRFRRVERLGFQGWAGISAWAKFAKVTR